jgi:hypothetical protein
MHAPAVPHDVQGQRTRPRTRPQPVADELAVEEERRRRAELFLGPRAVGEQRPVRDADCVQLRQRAVCVTA